MRVRELQTVYRLREVDDDGITGRRLRTPADACSLAAALPMPNGARLDMQPVEHFCALALDTKHTIRAFAVLSVGTLDASIVHPREVFGFACRQGAAAIVVAHNHPSGDPTPSPDDVQLTARLRAAGAVLGIDVIDHVIVSHTGQHSSLRERGQL